MIGDEHREDGPRLATFGQAMKVVFWSFFGVRRSSDHERDAVRLRPVHVILAGVFAAALLVAVLIAIVHSVVK